MKSPGPYIAARGQRRQRVFISVGSAAARAILSLLCLTALLVGPVRCEPTAEILGATDFQGGLIVHLGCGDGKLTADLDGGDGFLVC